MTTVRDRTAMIRDMSPQLSDGEFVFCSIGNGAADAGYTERAIAMFAEAEGRSFVFKIEDASILGFSCDLPMRCITLTVYSALDGTGLTAAVANVLAERDIPCNMIAAFHHDHVFVPSRLADAAMQSLLQLQDNQVI